jgi:predicted extracellular nuclease
MKNAIVLISTLAMAATACVQVQQPVSVTKALGKLELGFNVSADGQSVRVTPQAVLPDNAIAGLTKVAGQATDDGTFRYIYASFEFTNNTSSPFDHLTLYAYNQAANNAGGTAIKNLNNFGGSNVALNAQRLLPTHGMSASGATASILATREDLQVFSSSEANSVDVAATPSVIGANDTVLEYGFTARALDANGNLTGGRSIAPGAKGQITAAYKLPSGDVTGTAYSFVATFVVANETVTRVTRSPEETDAAANTRASALTAEQVVLGGVSSTYSGTQVALANARISTTPALLLEPTCAGAATLTPIYNIQGTGSSAALTGAHTIEGIVVGDFQSNDNTGLQGFYIQDRFGDGNPATSDAIFVDEFATTPDSTVAAGDYVRVSGTVSEFGTAPNTLTRIQPTNAAAVQVCGPRALPAPIKVAYPLTNGQTDLEAYEGMLVEITSPMTVTEHFQLGRFGETVLASAGSNNLSGTDNRLDQYTQFNAPSVAGLTAYNAENAKRRLLVDDGRTDQNAPVNVLGRNGGPLEAIDLKTLRGGDVVNNLTGVIDYRFNLYRLQPTGPINFQPTTASARPALPLAAPAGLRVATFNVLNYFVTLNAGGATFTNPCGTSQAPRGANTAAEFTRQKDKTVAAIRGLNADIIGLIEIQNNGSGATSAIVDLVSAVNAGQPTADQFAVVDDPAAPAYAGCDAIKVAFIYKPSRVTPNGSGLSTAVVGGVTVASGVAFTTPNGYDGNGDTIAAFDNNNRKPVAVTFKQISNNEIMTVVNNHFKSKGSSSGGTGDTDIFDGQGASNGTRLRAAQDLKAWLATNPTGNTDPDVLIMGDLNAYAKEDPVVELETTYTAVLPVTSYSYVFDGLWGSLDHILRSGSLASQVVAAQKVHINADEPTIIDYNIQLDNGTVVKTAAQQTSLYAADAFRSSDHDPVVVDLNLAGGSTVACTGIIVTPATASVAVAGNLQFTATFTPSGCSPSGSVTWASSDTNAVTINASGLASGVAAGSSTISATSGALSGNTTLIVNAVTLVSIAVTPANPSITVGSNQPFTATGTYSDSSTQNITAQVTWASSSTGVATINTQGLASGVATGSSQITATLGAISGNTTLTVTPVTTSGGVVISQVYGGGGASTGTALFNADYVELHNNSSNSVTLSGYSVQYASTGGAFSSKVDLPAGATIPAGGFYLIRLGNPGSVGSTLPAADVNGTAVNAAAQNGKLALVSSQTLLTCGAVANNCFPSGVPVAGIVDFVGYGTANNSEGNAAVGALSANSAASRNNNGCVDTNNNLADFTVVTSITPRNSASNAATCP